MTLPYRGCWLISSICGMCASGCTGFGSAVAVVIPLDVPPSPRCAPRYHPARSAGSDPLRSLAALALPPPAFIR